MLRQEDNEDRKTFLLRVCHEFIEGNCLEYNEVDYDNAACDGYRLLLDISIVIEDD